MAEFSGRRALSSGVGVIARNPKALVVWIVAYALAILPQLSLLAMMLPDFLALSDAANGGAPPEVGHMSSLEAKMAVLQPVQYATGMLAVTVFYGAVFRAVLEPEARAGFYLRLGRQELWLGLVMIVSIVMLALALGVVLVPFFVIAIVARIGAGSLPPAFGLTMVALVVLAACVLVWPLMRLSMALPMSFSTRKFMLFESWFMTRGHAWKILCVSLAMMGICLAIELGLFLVVLVAGFGLAAADSDGVATFFKAIVATGFLGMLPWLVGISLILSAVGIPLGVLARAPWASIYQDLSRTAEVKASGT